MKSRKFTWAAAMTFLAALALPLQLAAQKNTRYAVTDLGTLGGHSAQASAINDHGEAVGGSYLPGDVQIDAVLWRKGVITDLGTLDGDSYSFAFWINIQGQVVGNGSASGFLWEDGGPMVDLNTLVSSSSGLHVTQGDDINDRGEIAGVGALSNGNEHAVLLIPCDENHPGVEGCDYAPTDIRTRQQSQPATPRKGIMPSSTPTQRNHRYRSPPRPSSLESQ